MKEALPAYLLAGGRSRRFGDGDKLRAEIDGVSLLAHVAAELRPVASRVVAVADEADKYADLGIETIADDGSHQGPLVGLLAALGDLRADERWLLLVAGDLAHLRHAWLAPLLAARVDSDAAVAYRGGDRWQPVFALYSRAARHLVRRRLAEGQRSLQGLLDALGARAVAPPDDWRRLINVNDREQLARARGLGGEDDGG
ncbi:MAG: molybdenum cofactor guanylyltransferase [Myxococcales bacterium]|nr:molybdenum cofactor guanylyltransferase [Myxococcales bacterium]